MDIASNVEEEYQLQYYRDCTGTKFLSTLKDVVLQHIKDCIEEIKSYVEVQLEGPNEVGQQISEDCQNQLEKYTLSVNRAFEKIKEPVMQYFSIPQNITIDTDYIYSNYKNNFETLQQENEELEKDLIKQKMYNAILKDELRDMIKLEPLKEKLSDLKKILEFKSIPECTELKELIKFHEIYIRETFGKEPLSIINGFVENESVCPEK